MIANENIWRSKFHKEAWKYNDPNPHSWFELYKQRYRLDNNWKNGKFSQNRLTGHSDEINCVKFYKSWTLTGSQDSTIRIWDSKTYQCLKVLGDPDIEIYIDLGDSTDMEILEFIN